MGPNRNCYHNRNNNKTENIGGRKIINCHTNPKINSIHIWWKVFFFSPCLFCEKKRQWQPTPVLLPGKSHAQRNLVGCSPWGCCELDTTEQIHFHFSFFPCLFSMKDFDFMLLHSYAHTIDYTIFLNQLSW